MSSGTDTPPLPNTDDPYAILNIKPTSDSREIKRAYKRMALKYHPDVRTNSGSSSDERKRANDDFARINAAYSVLIGKAEEIPKSNSSSKKSTTDAYSSYSAPHRRKSANYGRSSSFNDWKDYVPKYDEAEYDAGGDSFASILTDFLAQVGSSSSGSVLNDFISFLEGNFPSVGSNKNVEEDLILESLLSRGDIDEIKLELDEAKLLVKQLEIKEMDLAAEIKTIEEKQVKETVTKRSYMDEMRLDENKKEVEARKEVVGDYLLRAKVRQMKLRKRYDELKQSKADDRSRKNATSVNNSYTTSPEGVNSTARSNETNSQQNTSEQESWRTQGFGSGRRRGRSRSDRSSNEYRTSSNQVSTPRSNENTSDQNIGNFSTRSSTLTSNVPPHRRIASSFKQQAEDKRRLREIKVDEEIDKMKKELGL